MRPPSTPQVPSQTFGNTSSHGILVGPAQTATSSTSSHSAPTTLPEADDIELFPALVDVSDDESDDEDADEGPRPKRARLHEFSSRRLSNVNMRYGVSQSSAIHLKTHYFTSIL